VRTNAGSARGPLPAGIVSAKTTQLTPSCVNSRMTCVRVASSASVVGEVRATSRPTTVAPLRRSPCRSWARYALGSGWRRPRDSKAASSMATMTTSEGNRWPCTCRRRSSVRSCRNSRYPKAEAPVTSRLQAMPTPQSWSRRARCTCHQPRGLIRICSLFPVKLSSPKRTLRWLRKSFPLEITPFRHLQRFRYSTHGHHQHPVAGMARPYFITPAWPLMSPTDSNRPPRYLSRNSSALVKKWSRFAGRASQWPSSV
jgi:hypothetical protein